MRDVRRSSPRIETEAMCWEVVGERETSALCVDLSTRGARVERPFVGGRIEHEVPLPLEVPGIDEVMWARGDVVFDQLLPVKGAGPFGLLRRTGYRVAIAAARDLRLLRDFIYARIEVEESSLMLASCYARG